MHPHIGERVVEEQLQELKLERTDVGAGDGELPKRTREAPTRQDLRGEAVVAVHLADRPDQVHRLVDDLLERPIEDGDDVCSVLAGEVGLCHRRHRSHGDRHGRVLLLQVFLSLEPRQAHWQLHHDLLGVAVQPTGLGLERCPFVPAHRLAQDHAWGYVQDLLERPLNVMARLGNERGVGRDPLDKPPLTGLGDLVRAGAIDEQLHALYLSNKSTARVPR